MSRRGKNNVKRAIVSDATSIFSGTTAPAKPTPINNFNPLFHYLQTMFPNYDNAVLNSVLEQEGNSIERAIEVLLTFAIPEEPKTSKDAAAGDEISFIDDFSDDDAEETPSNVFAVPVMPPVSSHNSGRDHVSLYEYRKKRKATKSQRARRRQRAHQVQAAAVAAAAAAQNNKKKVKWVPLQEFIAETANPFDALARDEELLTAAAESLVLGSEKETEEKLPATVADPEEDETRCLLSAEEIKEGWDEFESAQVLDDEPQAPVAVDCSFDDFDDFSDFSSSPNADEWLHYTPPTPQPQEEEETTSSSASSSCSSSEDEDFVVIQESLPSLQLEPLSTQPITVAPVVVTPAAAAAVVSEAEEKSEQVVVVKLYYSSSDIHRLGLARSTFTFAKLFDYAGAYLQSKCQQLLAKSALPRAFALTYVDDEGDVIHLCSEEELAEALRLHEQVFWTPGQQPVLRVHIKSLEMAANDGHIVVRA